MPYCGDRAVQGAQLIHKNCEGFQSHVLYLQFKPPSAIHQCTKCGIHDITVTGCCISSYRGGGPKLFKPCRCDNVIIQIANISLPTAAPVQKEVQDMKEPLFC